jgi:hypothetical protein
MEISYRNATQVGETILSIINGDEVRHIHEQGRTAVGRRKRENRNKLIF